MTMTKLREAFAAWQKAETGKAVLAYNFMLLLTDPTPISEVGLLGLGFKPDSHRKLTWRLGGIQTAVEDGLCAIRGENIMALVRTMGQLRLLLLSVGE